MLLFFFNDPPTSEIYPLSLHDALPICPLQLLQRREAEPLVQHPRQLRPDARQARQQPLRVDVPARGPERAELAGSDQALDRKSTRLNSSHTVISYAVFCLKKKKLLQSE